MTSSPDRPAEDPESPPLLFLTGGTGLVGSHVAGLWADRGARVRALIRPGSDARHLESLGCELVVGDLRRPSSYRGAAAGCEVAVHAAALVARPAPWEAYREVNVEGTRHVVRECLRSGVSRLVHLSSVAVYGHPEHHSLPIAEDAPTDVPLPDHAHYERSKRMAEDVVRRVAGEQLNWSILRPDVVFGERDRSFTPLVVRAASRRIVPLVGRGDNDLPVVYAGSVARAAWRAATRERAAGETYNVTDDGPLTQRELVEDAVDASDHRAVTVPVPEALARGSAAAVRRLRAPFRSGPPLLSRRRLWFLSHDDPFDCEKAARQLSWSPPLDSRSGWRRAVAWCRRASTADGGGSGAGPP